MIVTTKLIQDALNLVSVLQHARTADQVLSALGAGEAGRDSAFDIDIRDGVAEFNTLLCRKYATADNEALVYDQAKSLVAGAVSGPGIPNLGTHAVVTYDGTAVTTPLRPVDAQVYRLEPVANGLAWQPRPAGASLPNAVTVPMHIAIGTPFSSPNVPDLGFPSMAEFWTWLQARTVYEPLTLEFNPGIVHEVRFPVADSSYTGTGADFENQRAAIPVDLRRRFIGRGRLVFTVPPSATVLQLRHLALSHVKLVIECPTLLERSPVVSPLHHRAIDLRFCDIRLNNRVLVRQTGTYAPETNRDSVLYSTKLHRCTVAGTGSLELEADTGYHWGLITGCRIRDIKLSAYSTTVLPSGSAAARTAAYRAAWNRIGWRVSSSIWRGTTFYQGSTGETPVSSGLLRQPVSYTFSNVRAFFTDLVLGTPDSRTPVSVNFVHSFVRAVKLRVLATVLPTVVKLIGSSVLARGMSLTYPADQSGLALPTLDWSLLNGTPGWIHVQHSVFGVVDRQDSDLDALPLVSGDLAVKPTVYGDLGSVIHLAPSPTQQSQAFVDNVAVDGNSEILTH